MANQASVPANRIPAPGCSPSDTSSAAEKRIVLLIAILTGFLTQFGLSAVMKTLPSMAAEVRMDAVTLSWVSSQPNAPPQLREDGGVWARKRPGLVARVCDGKNSRPVNVSQSKFRDGIFFC